MKKLSFLLPFFLVNLLLISCSTSISDSSTSSKGLVIAVKTGSSKNVNRAALHDPYSITLTVTGGGYSDSQSKTVSDQGKVDFTFEEVPVGANVSVTCQIKLGSTIIYSAKKNNVKVEAEGTSVVLDLENQLLTRFVFSDDNLDNLQVLINACQVEAGETPTIVFEKEIDNLNSIVPYLVPGKACILDFSNMSRKTFTTDELILGQDGVQDVYVPSNSFIEVTLTDNNGILNDDGYLDSVYSMFSGIGATLKLTYTGDAVSYLPDVFVDDIVYNDIGTIELSGNIGIVADNRTTFGMFLELLKKPCTLKQVKNNDLSDYEFFANLIRNTSNLEVSELYLNIETDGLTIPSINVNNPPRVDNIKGLSIEGTGGNITIGKNAFRNWRGLSYQVVTISRKITTMKEYCFRDSGALLQWENYLDTWVKHYLTPTEDGVTSEDNISGITSSSFAGNVYFTRGTFAD